jgi:tetratricopeptide (TPR) repeat protein
MPGGYPCSRARVRVISLGLILILASLPVRGQRPPSPPSGPPAGAAAAVAAANNPAFDLDISVRDEHGNPLDAQATVHLSSPVLSYSDIEVTQSSSAAHFSSLQPGQYGVEVTCPGYRKATEQIIVEFRHESLPIYIYLVPESESGDKSAASGIFILPQQFRADMQRGMVALNKNQYEAARKIFAKVMQKAPGNPDVFYYLGLAELGLQHIEQAGGDFQHALSLDPKHELALVSLGYLQLQTGAPADAVISLEKAASLSHASWCTYFELATAYVKVQRSSEAESAAARAVQLAKEKGASAKYLLGQIQYAEGKRADAKSTWESIVTAFPGDPVASEAKKTLARLETESQGSSTPSNDSLPLPGAPSFSIVKVVERPWAPPDTDSAAYQVAPNANCKTDAVLDSALHRMNSDLKNFEKFSATEHIERQEIDRYGWAGPMRTHDYPYIVFVYPLGATSFYVTEYRSGEDDKPDASEAITSTNLNSMGVNVLQPFYRQRFDYSCEGVSNVRGQAAWQVHFIEKKDAKGEGVRTWRLNYETYDVAVKGRIWISSVSYAVLRVETDLRDPVKGLELTKDHLTVDYGPVNFSTGNKQLWLPWSADSYMERRGRRYHQRHLLSNYLLFDVETTHKIGKSSEATLPSAGSSP